MKLFEFMAGFFYWPCGGKYDDILSGMKFSNPLQYSLLKWFQLEKNSNR